MWKCQNCETLNDGEFCIICGESKATSEAISESVKSMEINEVETDNYIDHDNTYLEKNSLKRQIAIDILIAIAVMIGIVFFCISNIYATAYNQLNNGDYASARAGFENITFYKDANDLLVECDYQEAISLLENGEAQSAKQIFTNISYYKDSSDMKKQCDYTTASWEMYNGDLLSAFDIFTELDDYGDSETQLEATKQLIYDKGVELYKADNYSEAKEYFDKSQNKGRETDYRTLINAHVNHLDDISALYNLIGFEDTTEILSSDKYIDKFLLDRWQDYSGNFIEYYKSNNEDVTSAKWNLPWTGGKYYKLENGIHLHGDDENGWTKQWSCKIISGSSVNVYCYKDGRTYTLNRQ